MPTTTITGANGTWELDITDNTPPAEDEIKIKFTPKKNATGCKNIRLAQTVQLEGYNAKGEKIASKPKDIYADQKDNPFRHREDDEIDDGSGNTIVIDHHSCEKDPFYNGDDTQDTSSKGDATTDPPTGTEMTDAPGRGFGPDKKPEVVRIVLTFRTCAICVDSGEILGCVCWTSESTRTPANRGQIALTSADAECATSDAFKAALKKFMQNHSGKKAGEETVRYYCPDDRSFGDPLPEGMKQYLTAVAAPVKEGTFKKTTMSSDKKIPRYTIGGMVRINTIAKVLKMIREVPGAAAFKFTWTGDQTKVLPSFILSPQELSDAVIASFMDRRPEMKNDFIALKFHTASAGVMVSIAQFLLQKPKLINDELVLPVMLTAVANLGQPQPMFAVAGMVPSDFLQLIKTVNPPEEEGLAGVLDYLRLNMGLDWNDAPAIQTGGTRK